MLHREYVILVIIQSKRNSSGQYPEPFRQNLRQIIAQVFSAVFERRVLSKLIHRVIAWGIYFQDLGGVGVKSHDDAIGVFTPSL